ncbi:hypothetical protein [Polyangium sp. 15x6]|uniref:hypothetical protein n=1 Tax=Polyangium sp. 15x6 TaxID=3042687 RepID=UPI00249A8231|nr:hypothetical protein [Polyangium sp. 15x6]MDI3285476.1 hypothetical protein [Polyangium sp. 15x6]
MKSTYTLFTLFFASFAAGCGAKAGLEVPVDSSCQAPSFTRSIELGAAMPAEGESSLGGLCLDEVPYLDALGDASCFVLDVRAGGGACTCDAAQGFAPVAPEHAGAVAGAASDCVCEVLPIAGDPAHVEACLNVDLQDDVVVDDQPVNGWCYVDPPRGNPALIASCPSDSPRMVRFAGAATQEASVLRTVFVVCQTGPAVCDG